MIKKILVLSSALCVALEAKPSVKPSSTQEVTSMKQLREILNSAQPSVLMFYAPWCSACKTMKEHFDSLNHTFGKRVIIAKINVDQEALKDAVDSFGIERIPTICIKNVGVITKEKLQTALEALVGVEPKTTPQKPTKQSSKKTIAKKQPSKPALKKKK